MSQPGVVSPTNRMMGGMGYPRYGYVDQNARMSPNNRHLNAPGAAGRRYRPAPVAPGDMNRQGPVDPRDDPRFYAPYDEEDEDDMGDGAHHPKRNGARSSRDRRGSSAWKSVKRGFNNFRREAANVIYPDNGSADRDGFVNRNGASRRFNAPTAGAYHQPRGGMRGTRRPDRRSSSGRRSSSSRFYSPEDKVDAIKSQINKLSKKVEDLEDELKDSKGSSKRTSSTHKKTEHRFKAPTYGGRRNTPGRSNRARSPNESRRVASEHRRYPPYNPGPM